MNILTHINTARALVIAAFLLGWGSLRATASHIGNELYLLVPESQPQTHAWYHFFRELGHDFATMAAVVLILFAPARHRTPVAWWVMLVLMMGFYAPFWIGMPFMAELSAPSPGARLNHFSMAIPALLGCFLAKRHFTGVDSHSI